MSAIASAFTGPASPWLPADSNLLGANADPALSQVSLAATAGTLYLVKLPVRQAVTVSSLWFNIISAGSGASTGSFAGLYSAAGQLLTGSADIGGMLTAAGPVTVPLTTPQAFAGGLAEAAWPWAAILVNLAVTQPTLARLIGGAAAAANVGLTAAGYRFAANGTGQASLPASVTPASNLATGGTWWAGWS